MIRDNFHLISHFYMITELLIINNRMFIVHIENLNIWPSLNKPKTLCGTKTFASGLCCNSLCTNICNHPFSSRTADNGCKNCRSVSVQRAIGICLRGIHENVSSRTYLRNSLQNRKIMHHRWSRTDTDRFKLHPLLFCQTSKFQCPFLSRQMNIPTF